MLSSDPSPARQATYDLVVQQLIPGYASLARLSVSLLSSSPLASGEGAAVLVAGCGTGAELLEADAQRPDWRLTAIDPSTEMLAVAQQRLRDRGTIDWHCTTVEALGADARFDGALSVLVLQSLPDDGTKLSFLTALARSLRPGGQLVLVDLMRPERSPLSAQVAEAWQGFQRASGVVGEGVDLTGQIQGFHPIGIARLTALVEAAGLSDPAPFFQALDFQGFLLQRRA
ncbi:class I SAM-dependent methyltransferase [Synechococcus sp. CCY 9618]|uniref:class I SAM-dependent methyltransferase n=1 Tax=Synechococcus sp. CCY 9618 TaxID=2815602 RepID=UPI001C24F200|nr:class I SAM-dependent methyltransferase [Synechococcus sp. CCY 9618]